MERQKTYCKWRAVFFRGLAAIVFLPLVAGFVHFIFPSWTFSGFLRTPQYISWVLPIAVVYFLLGVSVIFAPLIWTDLEFRRYKVSKFELMLAVAGIALFSFMLPNLFLPVIVYCFSNQNGSIESTVNRINLHPGRRSRCQAMLVAEYDPGAFSKICIDAALAKQLQAGDPIQIQGRWNPYLGMFVKQVVKSR